MIFPSRYQIDIPAVDILTYVFGTPALQSDPPLFVDAGKPSEALPKGELETCVKRLAGGLRQAIKLQDDDVVVAFAKNCVWYPVVFLGAICAEDGWLKTGDVVKFQRNGLLTIVDRKKEFIKVGGVQVAPAELEGHLLEHELVKDCAVIRVMRDGQECLQAHIVPAKENLDMESIVDFMDHRLAAYKRLTGGVVFTKAIPKSGSGKILRRLIQDPEAAPWPCDG
ncbi:hypothetical protein GQ607_006889 [Colletotrichum asianum]|uniref:AMP-binding enzyme C-terminal domain-containing protein n=1 Tax=Colletotrichum asianum TaxID=702518 RepID=A0A8H3WJK2_9PEZI|nr:hypothetical protein GQ607_006889 [Colletotrichum asianum]